MQYDLAIIGGGPAGYTAAEQAHQAGLQVILFESTALGGTCLNVGCIPTKTLLHSAHLYQSMLQSAKFGVNATGVTFDYNKMQQRKTKVVRKLAAGIRMRLQGCEVINAQASVLRYTASLITLQAGDTTYEAHQLFVCTGSHTFMPPIAGLPNNPCVWDSTAALNAKELPQSLLIIGGGVIGMEFATLFHSLGVSVTVVEALPTILPNIDKDLVAALQTLYTQQGIHILTSTKVESLDQNRITITHDNAADTLEADKILVCVGRRANLEGLENLPLELERGAIKVNDFMQTNLPNVYAAGDVTGKMMLAHVATRQAEVALGRLLKRIPLQRIAYNAIPSVVYTQPEIATIGLTEQDLTGPNCVLPIPYEVHLLPMTYSGRFVAQNEGAVGLCKIIVEKKNQTILGVHCLGDPCSEFIAAASFAVRMGYTLPEFQQVVFPHPTVAEIMRETVLSQPKENE